MGEWRGRETSFCVVSPAGVAMAMNCDAHGVW